MKGVRIINEINFISRKKTKITLVIPCYNEEFIIQRFYNETKQVLNEINNISFEFLFIDDGSKDNTLLEIINLSNKDNQVKYISFSRNFGKESAILAGLEHSNADYIILMDADLEHPPKLIHKFINNMEDYDTVIACRKNRKDGFFSDLFVKIINLCSKNIHLKKGMVDYRIINRKIIDSVLLLKEKERYSRGIFDWIGFSKKYIYYKDVKLQNRKSHWNFFSLFHYALSGIFSFSNILFDSIIMIGCFLFVMTGIYTISSLILHKFSFIVFLILLLSSIVETSLGICSLYIKRIYQESKDRPSYLIQKTNIGDSIWKKER